jgi:hypothetical protein
MANAHLHLIVGEFGSGKSFLLLEYGAALAERYHKCLVANFPIDLRAFADYCSFKGYKWLLSMIALKRVFYIPSVRPEKITELLNRPNSVVLLDEAGIFLNARSWKATPPDFLASLVQVRKDGVMFVLACHFLEQVDKQLRDNAQAIVECRGLTIYDRALRRPRLVYRWWHIFKPRKYAYWLSDPRHQQNWLITFFHAAQTHSRFVVPWTLRLVRRRSLLPSWCAWLFEFSLQLVPSADARLFRCFDSFHRLDKQKDSRPKYLMSRPNTVVLDELFSRW